MSVLDADFIYAILLSKLKPYIIFRISSIEHRSSFIVFRPLFLVKRVSNNRKRTIRFLNRLKSLFWNNTNSFYFLPILFCLINPSTLLRMLSKNQDSLLFFHNSTFYFTIESRPQALWILGVS